MSGPHSLWIKICGITSIEDAELVVKAGADAIGLNFAKASPRYLEPSEAKKIVQALGPVITWVGVFVDSSREELRLVQEEVGLDLLQLHGSEPPQLIQDFAPIAYKALRVGGPEDVGLARSMPGDRILVDSKVKGMAGGSGQTFDWSLLGGLAEERRVVLAGGLGPHNVESAISAVRPFGIDTASGVEQNPRKKDAALVESFLRLARAQSLAVDSSPSVR